MCLTVLNESISDIKYLKKRATKDLYVLKIVRVRNKEYVPYYRHHWNDIKYKIGRNHKSTLRIDVNIFNILVHEGLHSFYDAINTRKITNFYFDRQDVALLLCKIPKGATYILGIQGEVVSTQLTCVSVLYDSKKYKSNQIRNSIKTLPSLIKQGINFIKQHYPNNNLSLR